MGTGAMPQLRSIAAGAGWSIDDVVCSAGPSDPVFEERHASFSFAAVVGGSFTYRQERHATLLVPGAFLLGNTGRCFECGHEHGTGDRCIAFHLGTEPFGEIAAAIAGSSRYRFPVDSLPVSALTLPVIASAERLARDAEGGEETVLRIAEAIMAGLAERPTRSLGASARELGRVSAVLRYIEENAADPLDLAMLSAHARMSRYHFLRTFRKIAGMTPYQFLLTVRMRKVAVALATTRSGVADLAFEAGFGDLSTFNRRFLGHFGMSPAAYRRKVGVI